MSIMQLNLANQITSFQRMKPKELRETYHELHGEPTKSGNKQWLIRRCAWRIQSNAEGDLPDRTKRIRKRAAALARHQDIRVIPPKEMVLEPVGQVPDMKVPSNQYLTINRDARLPPPGTILKRTYKGQDYQVEVLSEGFLYEDKHYATLSAVANAITGGHWNDYYFFNLAKRKGRQ